MVDPFNVAGLAMAGLTLPAQLFSSCVFAYTTITTVKDMGSSINTLYWMLKVQETRFLVWGQNWDVFGRGLNPTDLSTLVYETIVATLVQINTLLEDTTELCTRYGLQSIGESQQPEASSFARAVRRQSTLVFRVQKSCSIFRKMRWAVRDQAKFADLIKQLTAFNDCLYQFRPLPWGPSLASAVNAETLAQTLVDGGMHGVQQLQQGARAGGTSMQSMENVAEALLVSRPREAAENATGGPSAVAATSPNLQIDSRQLEMLNGIPNDTPNRRSWARLRTNHPPSAHSPYVIVEWRSYNQMRVIGVLKSALQVRIEALVRMLRHEPKPRGFRVLDCLGYFEDNASSRFGLVFWFPRETARHNLEAPLTLFQVLSTKTMVPFLGSRFRLATALSESVYELHASGWLHKSVSSHNILFFGTNPVSSAGTQSQPLSLENPYFTGFALSRPDDPNATSSQTAVERELAVYRHPDVQGFSGGTVAPYRAEYDIYSLGTVLLEIGTWLRVKSIYRDGLSSYDFRNLLLTTYVPMLGSAMGENYMVAVRKCLDGGFDGLQGFGRNGRNLEDYNLNLKRSFYWEVVKPLGDCRV